MIRLIGEYEATLDAKGRFLLPSKIKKDLGEDNNNLFVVNTGFEGCLDLYPKKSWDLKINELRNYDVNDRDTRFLTRYISYAANEIELDSANRLLLPKKLMMHAGLKKDIILSCMLDKIEVWDLEKYNKFFENFTEEMYSDLAQKVKLKSKL